MDDFRLKEFKDENGQKHVVAIECDINGRKFIITNGKKIFEVVNGHYRKCKGDDPETAFLKKYTDSPKSNDIVHIEEIR